MRFRVEGLESRFDGLGSVNPNPEILNPQSVQVPCKSSMAARRSPVAGQGVPSHLDGPSARVEVMVVDTVIVKVLATAMFKLVVVAAA